MRTIWIFKEDPRCFQSFPTPTNVEDFIEFRTEMGDNYFYGKEYDFATGSWVDIPVEEKDDEGETQAE